MTGRRMKSPVLRWIAGPLILSSCLLFPGFSDAETFRSLNVSRAANMGLADEQPGDGSGGWTDQGPASDMRVLPTGRREFLGVPFKVIDPGKNDGRSVVVLAGRDRPDLPMEAVIPGDQARGSVLYFLHTCAWGGTSKSRTVAEYEVRYTGGVRETIPLRVGVEFTNWWGIREGDACEVAWVHEAGGVRRGLNLFAWKNPHPDLAIESLVFRSLKKMPVPILLAVTVADDPVDLRKTVEKTVRASHGEWPALPSPSGEWCLPAFDLRQVRDFKDERYWGITVDPSALLVEPMGPKAAYWAAYGCNLVMVVPPAGEGAAVKTSRDLDALRSAVAVLEKEGIRVCSGERSAAGEVDGKPVIPEDVIPRAFLPGTAVPVEGSAPSPVAEQGSIQFEPGPTVREPEGSFLLGLAGSRLHGRPFVAHWNSGFPNEYNAERAILMAWASVFQGWDACVLGETFNFPTDDQAAGDAGSMPAFRAHVPAAALAVRRGDLKAARVRWICGEDPCGLEGLVHAAGRKSGSPSKADNVGVDVSMVDHKNRTIKTDTGQTIWQGNVGLFLVDAPRFQAAAGFLANRKITNNVWNTETSNEFAVLSAVSLTKTGITRSSRVLITGVARAANTGMEFNRKADVCLDPGGPPVRLEPLQATVTLHRTMPEPSLRVRALDWEGIPMERRVPYRWRNNDLVMTWIPGAVYLLVSKP